MAVSDREVGLPELMAELRKHHARLEEHCKRTERFVLKKELRRGIGELSATYELLEWCREFLGLLKLLKARFSPCLTVAERVIAERKLDARDHGTIKYALEQSQESLNELGLHIQDSTEQRWKRSENNPVKVLQTHHKSIKDNLQAGNFGILADEIDNFWNQLDFSFTYVNKRIEELAEDIGKIAGEIAG